MSARASESRDFRRALVLTALIVGAFVGYARWGSTPSTSPTHPSQTASPPVIAVVYECNQGAGRIFSDQPCAKDALRRDVLAPNSMPSERTQTPTAADPGARARVVKAGEAHSRTDEKRCAWIQQQADEINARMREGYKEPEGNRLRRQLQDLSDQRWEANCRHR